MMAKLNAIVPPAGIIKKYNLDKVIEAELQGIGKLMKKALESTTATWETDVKFEVETKIDSGNASVTVGTTNEIYKFVSGGTKPHVIRPKKAKFLSFQSGYSPKTRPGFLGSTAGGRSGPVAFAKEVHHPGTKARKFHEKVAIKYAYLIERNMKLAVAAALRGK